VLIALKRSNCDRWIHSEYTVVTLPTIYKGYMPTCAMRSVQEGQLLVRGSCTWLKCSTTTKHMSTRLDRVFVYEMTVRGENQCEACGGRAAEGDQAAGGS
jgi:hypothetical protein